VSTGVHGLDEMMGGKGYYRGTSVFVTGTAGTGKTSLASSFVKAACERGEKCLYFAFEESPSQIIRNMRSVNIDLEPWHKNGQLVFHAIRPTMYGLETHLASMVKLVGDNRPSIVVVDPISNLISAGEGTEVKSMLTRLIDYLKSHGISSLFTSLTGGQTIMESKETGISSLMDTWIGVQNIEINGERNRGLYVLKSRGMAHSNKVREFVLTDHGIKLMDAYIGPQGLLVGTARGIQQTNDEAAALAQEQENDNMLRALDEKRNLMEARIAAMRAEFEAEEAETKRTIARAKALQVAAARNPQDAQGE